MSALEDELAMHIRGSRLPEPVREYAFAKPRRYRFDFAWPDIMLSAEVEGGTWVNGRHSRGKAFSKDCAKYNLATLLGWRVLRFTTDMVESGEAVATIEKALQRND